MNSYLIEKCFRKYPFLNFIIWFLTDTDFSKEWYRSSLLKKLELCYTTIGMIFFEILSFAIFVKGFGTIIEKMF